MKPDLVREVQPLATLVVGMAGVLTLAMQKIIVDGETVAALSSVLSASMGSHALKKVKTPGSGDDK